MQPINTAFIVAINEATTEQKPTIASLSTCQNYYLLTDAALHS